MVYELSSQRYSVVVSEQWDSCDAWFVCRFST